LLQLIVCSEKRFASCICKIVTLLFCDHSYICVLLNAQISRFHAFLSIHIWLFHCFQT